MPSEQAVLAPQFDDIEQQREADSLGMWVFLVTETLIFGALFVSFAVYRSWYARDFEAASGRLNVLIGGINTVVLLTSSLTMALAVHACRTGQQRRLLVWLILTALLGTTFMGLKGIEYYSDYRDNLVPRLAFQPDEWTLMEPPANPQHVQILLMLYYIMTGLHAVHLTIGIGVLVLLSVLAARGRFSAERYMPIEITALYWHFVDVIWIFLLPMLYLSGTHTLADLFFMK